MAVWEHTVNEGNTARDIIYVILHSVSARSNNLLLGKSSFVKHVL